MLRVVGIRYLIVIGYLMPTILSIYQFIQQITKDPTNEVPGNQLVLPGQAVSTTHVL